MAAPSIFGVFINREKESLTQKQMRGLALALGDVTWPITAWGTGALIAVPWPDTPHALAERVVDALADPTCTVLTFQFAGDIAHKGSPGMARTVGQLRAFLTR